MPIRVKCGGCNKVLGVKDEHAGKKIKCPVCQGVVAVPHAAGQNGSAGTTPGSATATKPVPAGKVAPAAKKPVAEADKPVAAPPHSDGPPPEHADDAALSVFSEDEAPKEVEGPTTIEFVCEWCDEKVQLPIEMAGKQTQCPNQECRRIVKVPLPKIEAKKDWRKMNRAGPAAALVNQPEQLENAWGTQEATRARQASLAQAGVIPIPRKPPIGAAGWILRGFYAVCVLGAVSAAGYGLLRLRETKEEKDAITEIKSLKIADPVGQAERNRVIGLIVLRSKDGKAGKAQESFSGAQSLVSGNGNAPTLHEQIFLGDLALSQLEMAGSTDKLMFEDEILRKAKLPWEDIKKALEPTLAAIPDPLCQVIAVRELTTRLLAKNQQTIAVGLVAHVSPPLGNEATAPILAQKIALDYLRGDQETLENAQKLLTGPKGMTVEDEPRLRVGCAEGCARKGEFDNAFKLADNGSPEEKLEACVGVAAIILGSGDATKKDEAAKFVKEALKVALNPKESSSPWLCLHLVNLAARTLEPGAESDADLKKLVEDLPDAFKARAELELFIAKCEKSATPIDPKALDRIEALGKQDPTALGLAWFALAQQHARMGQNRTQVQKAAADYPREDQTMIEKIRPMVDLGWYLGNLR